MNSVYLLLGSNRGDRFLQLQSAVSAIKEQIGEVIDSSGIYETQPWGFDDEVNFLNQCLLVESNYTAKEVLQHTKEIEKQLGRPAARTKYEGRLIDIDILFFNQDLIVSDELTIPHPLLHERGFVLAPLCEISPELVHPVLGQTIRELLEHSNDGLVVRRLS